MSSYSFDFEVVWGSETCTKWVYGRYRSQKIDLLSATLFVYILQGNWLQIEYKNQALEYIETKSESKPNVITCNTYFIVLYYDEFFSVDWIFRGLKRGWWYKSRWSHNRKWPFILMDHICTEFSQLKSVNFRNDFFVSIRYFFNVMK